MKKHTEWSPENIASVKTMKGARPEINKSWAPKHGTGARRSWSEGIVDTKTDHIRIRYGEGIYDSEPVALVAQGQDGNFIVQWLLNPNTSDKKAKTIREKARRELDFYLVEKEEEDPWKYAQYHCTTASNIYSSVHWGWYPEGYED